MNNISEKNSNFTKYSSSYYLPFSNSILKALWEIEDKQKSHIQESECVIEVQDNRLRNWERWLKVHEEQTKHLANKLNKPSQCLLMNSECKRYVNEQKWLIEKCDEYVVSDYYRGHPDFWKVPGRRNFDRTKPDPLLPQLDYVGVPDRILQEQGITERCLPTIKEKWDNSIFVKDKLNDLKDKLQVIEAHRPDINLMVSGKRMFLPPDEYGLDKITYDVSSEDTYDSRHVELNELDPTLKSELADEEPLILQLGDVMLESRNSSTDKTGEPLIWRIVFKDCNMNKTYEQMLDFNNLSTSSIRYEWKIKLPPQFNHHFPFKVTRKFVPRFNFNKTSDVLLPFRKQKFKFWFKSDIPGIFKEQWELQTDPVFNEGRPLIITLEGFVFGLHDSSHVDKINRYIRSQIISTRVKNTVDEILIRSKYDPTCQQISYDTKFSEEEIFLHNNPALYYDSNSVTILKYLNKKISDEPWDYSVKNMRDKLLNKKIEDLADKQESIRIFYNALHKLQQPSLKTTLLNRRHMAVYRILGNFIETMDVESLHLKRCFYMDGTASVSSVAESGSSKQKYFGKREQKIQPKNRISRTYSLKESVNLTDKSIESNSAIFSIPESEVGDSKSLSSLETENQFRKQKYFEIFYIKTYALLSEAVDKIFLTLSSIDLHEETSICRLLQKDA